MGVRRHRRLLPPLGLLALAGLAVLVGCDQEDGVPKRNTPNFPHDVHVEDEEIECSVCHKGALKEDKAGMPDLDSCMKCHKGLDAKKPEAKRVSNFDKNGVAQFSNFTHITEDVKFSHKRHVDAKVQCGSCHKGIEKSKKVTAAVRVTMKDCMDCHAKQKVGVRDNAKDSCLVCHTYITREWKPANHQDNWKELHGREAGFVAKGSTASCDLCHTQQSCTKCHREEAPKNHTDYWRLRGHGVMAEMDRSCKVCHTEDFCVRCHRTTAPQNHRGDFETNHCTSCHFPLRDNTCFVCHKGTPSHNAAAPTVPNTHAPTLISPTDCQSSTCHGGLLAPHPDAGTDCLNCHRR